MIEKEERRESIGERGREREREERKEKREDQFKVLEVKLR